MPRLSQFFIKSSLLYLLAGFTIGAMLLTLKGWAFAPQIWRLLPVHIEIVIFGWILQLVMGVAFWMLPRFGETRGNEKLAWMAFLLMNVGILLNLSAVFFHAASLAFAGRLLEIGAVISFVIHAWPRVKPFAK